MKLTPTHAQQLTRAVDKAESSTSAEVVLVVLPRSFSQWGGASLLGGLSAFIVLALVLFLEELEFDPAVALVAVALVGLGVVGAMLLLPPQLFARASTLKKRVDDKAHAAFSRQGVYRTSARTGILVFLSLAERQARLLYDVGVTREVPAELREEWRARFAAVAKDFEIGALAAALEQLGQEAGGFLPRSADDVDELANAPQVDA
jgi:putative membrane protein